jgi:hypothetical protein
MADQKSPGRENFADPGSMNVIRLSSIIVGGAMLGVLGSATSGSVPTLSGLTAVALDAAVQLDRKRRGRDADDAPLKELSDRLRGASELQPGGTALSLHCNSAALGVLSRAIEQSTATNLKTVSDLAQEISRYVNILSGSMADWDDQKLANSLAFCLSLHRELVAELSHSEAVGPHDDWTGGRSWIL